MYFPIQQVRSFTNRGHNKMSMSDIDYANLSLEELNAIQKQILQTVNDRVSNAPSEIAKLVSEINTLVQDVKRSGDSDLSNKCKAELEKIEGFTRRNYSEKEKLELVNSVITNEWQSQKDIMRMLRNTTNNTALQVASFEKVLNTIAEKDFDNAATEGTDKVVKRYKWKRKAKK
jgi:uncharacterized coiled-coil protein SlyX